MSYREEWCHKAFQCALELYSHFTNRYHKEFLNASKLNDMQRVNQLAALYTRNMALSRNVMIQLFTLQELHNRIYTFDDIGFVNIIRQYKNWFEALATGIP